MGLTASDRRLISTKKAPAAIGPYSQGVRVGDFLFVSGQLPLDPQTQQFASGEIKGQTEQVILNVKAILDTEQMSLSSVVKVTIFLADMNLFAEMNEVYQKYFGLVLPARSTVEVARLPKDALIEIEVVAVAII